MKTIITIEIKTKDKYNVYSEEVGAEPEDKEGKGINKQFREQYPKDLHDYIVDSLKHFIKNDFEENTIDSMEETSIEGWDTFKEYGVKIKLKSKEVKND